MTIPLVPLPVIDPTGRPPIELVSGALGTGAGGSGSGIAKSPGEIAMSAGGQWEYVGLTTAVTEWCEWWRDEFDLTAWTEARLVVDVVAAADAGIKGAIQYSTDQSAWTTLCEAAIDATGTIVGTYTTMPADTAADVWLRFVTHG